MKVGTFRPDCKEFFAERIIARERQCSVCDFINFEVFIDKVKLSSHCSHFISIQTGLNNDVNRPDGPDTFTFSNYPTNLQRREKCK